VYVIASDISGLGVGQWQVCRHAEDVAVCTLSAAGSC